MNPDLNLGPHMRHMDMYDHVEVIRNCLAYAFEQARTSDIDILGETREENLKRIAQTYWEFHGICNSTFSNVWNITRNEVVAAMKGEL